MMKYEMATKQVLNEFKISKRYVGYDYIVYGIDLMERDKSSIGHITKSLYIDIAARFNTTSICVERNIRATIEMMWKNKMNNLPLLVSIFGEDSLTYRPTNTRFFELLYEYVEANCLEIETMRCPFFGCRYCVLKYIDMNERML